jgi:hypothetical protein
MIVGVNLICDPPMIIANLKGLLHSNVLAFITIYVYCRFGGGRVLA